MRHRLWLESDRFDRLSVSPVTGGASNGVECYCLLPLFPAPVPLSVGKVDWAPVPLSLVVAPPVVCGFSAGGGVCVAPIGGCAVVVAAGLAARTGAVSKPNAYTDAIIVLSIGRPFSEANPEALDENLSSLTRHKRE